VKLENRANGEFAVREMAWGSRKHRLLVRGGKGRRRVGVGRSPLMVESQNHVEHASPWLLVEAPGEPSRRSH
jgi:hypothetical protein